MSKCTCVYETRKNSRAVREGYVMSGSIMKECDNCKSRKAAKSQDQAQASKPIAVVTGWYDGRCVIEPLDRALAIPVGMALYTAPPAAAVNQQLPEGYVLAPVEPTEAMLDAGVAVAFAASVHGKKGWNNYMKALYRAFIAAAQEQK